MYNNNVVVRVVMRVAVRVMMHVMLVDNHGWFMSDDDFIGTYHRCECQKGGEN